MALVCLKSENSFFLFKKEKNIYLLCGNGKKIYSCFIEKKNSKFYLVGQTITTKRNFLRLFIMNILVMLLAFIEILTLDLKFLCTFLCNQK